MTKQSKSGMKASRKVTEHELLAKGSQVEQIETDTVRLEDDGQGKPVILRRFQFQLPPGVKEINKELLLKEHVKKLEIFLWKDELEMIMPPKLVLEQNGAFSIFATCQPKKGSLLLQKPQLIQDALRNP